MFHLKILPTKIIHRVFRQLFSNHTNVYLCVKQHQKKNKNKDRKEMKRVGEKKKNSVATRVLPFWKIQEKPFT